eukprot:3679857-Pyramimonas_sp.AAC.1
MRVRRAERMTASAAVAASLRWAVPSGVGENQCNIPIPHDHLSGDGEIPLEEKTSHQELGCHFE